MTNPLCAADCRRATALVVHHGRTNVDGVNELFKEAVEADRVVQLLLATVALYAYILPVLVTNLGMRCLSEIVVGLAEKGSDENGRRAARLVIAHSRADLDAINAVIIEARDASKVAELFMSLMGLYSMLVPALNTRVGLDALQAAALDLATLEVNAQADGDQ